MMVHCNLHSDVTPVRDCREYCPNGLTQQCCENQSVCCYVLSVQPSENKYVLEIQKTSYKAALPQTLGCLTGGMHWLGFIADEVMEQHERSWQQDIIEPSYKTMSIHLILVITVRLNILKCSVQTIAIFRPHDMSYNMPMIQT